MKNPDSYYMTTAYLVATSSKDRRTKIGAVIVGKNGEIRATGYNGFPRGCDDDDDSRHNRPEKYYWTEHAERNAIYNAARVGTPLDGCTIYVVGCPCADCARAIIQTGIKRVVVHKEFEDRWTTEKWKENKARSLKMFEETGVRYTEWSGELTRVSIMQSGVEYDY